MVIVRTIESSVVIIQAFAIVTKSIGNVLVIVKTLWGFGIIVRITGSLVVIVKVIVIV